MKSSNLLRAFLTLSLLALFNGEAGEGTGNLPVSRMTDKLKPALKLEPYVGGKFEFAPNETIVFVGPENIVTEQRSGYLESHLTLAAKEKSPRFRHMGWEGDTVYRQNRMQNHGTWKENLDAVDATAVFVWFGQLEAFDGKPAAEFKAAYGRLLDEFSKRTPRIVMLSPTPFEKPVDARVPDNTSRNSLIKEYAQAARELARERSFVFVDLFEPLSESNAQGQNHTRDGLHLTPRGFLTVSGICMKQLGLNVPAEIGKELRDEIVEKNRIWFDTWRCMNWAFAYGDRTTQPFAKPNDKFPSFVDDLKRYAPLVANADARVLAISAGKPPPEKLPVLEPPAAPMAKTPEEQMANFTLHPGFSIKLFADEKNQIVKPIQMRWDERGRMWVLCVPSYPQLLPGHKANDYLLIVEDTDKDGIADSSKIFAQGLNMPMGFEFSADGVYICESTQLTHWRDTNNDGLADEQSVVLSGFGTGDSHQMINSLRWCPDGHLWFTQGYHIWSYVETPHGVSELNRSGVWRFNPRTLKLDGFFNDSTAGLNSWGVTFDNYGQVFHGGGANTSLYFSTPGLIPTLHVLQYRHDFCVSRGKSMEPEFLQSRHLPDDLQGVLLKSTYFTSQVSMYKIQDDGAGFKGVALPDLIASKSNEFRPLETRVGPDGALYICDWLNPIIGHYQASYRDPRRDKTHGRIWRMTADGRALVERPALEEMKRTLNAAELLQLLKSPERWTRDQARRLLYLLPKAAAVSAADKLVETLTGRDAETEQFLYEISGVFCAHEETRAELVERFLTSNDFRVRAWGVRLIGYWHPKLPDAVAWLRRAAGDEHPRVRMEVCVAASYVGTLDALKAATLVLDKPLDFYISYALTQSIHALALAFEKALAAGAANFDGRTRALAHVLNTLGGKSNAAAIMQLIDSGKTSEASRENLLIALAESGGPNELAYVLKKGAQSGPVLNALEETARLRKVRPSGDLEVAVGELISSKDFNVEAAAWRLIALWRLKIPLDLPTAVIVDQAKPANVRAAALRAFAAIHVSGSTKDYMLQKWLNEDPNEVKLAALESIAVLDLKRGSRFAVQLLSSAKNADEAGLWFKPILIQSGGAELLASQLGAGDSIEAAQFALQWLARSGYDDPELLAALNLAAGNTTVKREFSAELVAKIVAEAATKGDAKRGEAVFKSDALSCLKCHKIGNEGTAIGPDLTSLSRGQTKEQIVESTLWPKRQVKEGFLLTQIITKSGNRHQGLKHAETTSTLTLRNTDDGKLEAFDKAEIKKRNDAGTVMPDGLTDRLTNEQLADLIRYLTELGK